MALGKKKLYYPEKFTFDESFVFDPRVEPDWGSLCELRLNKKKTSKKVQKGKITKVHKDKLLF